MANYRLVVSPLLLTLLCFSLGSLESEATSQLSWNDESCASLPLFENLTDSAFSSSGESRANREPAHVRSIDQGWCPKEPTDSLSHIYLEVTFQSLVNIMAVDFSTSSDENGASSVVEKYMVDYQRGEESSDWLRYTQNNAEILKGGIRYDIFNPPIIARRLRFIPYSDNPSDICVAFQLYGCSYPDGVISYEVTMPSPLFDDLIYDAPRRSDSLLQNGVGYLTDGTLGNSTGFGFSDNSQKFNWVGWSSQPQPQRRPVDFVFKFDSLRNFTSCRIYFLTYRELNVYAAASASFIFIHQTSSRPDREFLNTQRTVNQNGDRWYEYTFTRPRIASQVRLSLVFGGPATLNQSWLLASEVKFQSSPVEPILKSTATVKTTRRVWPTLPTGLSVSSEQPEPETDLKIVTSPSATTTASAVRRPASKKPRIVTTASVITELVVVGVEEAQNDITERSSSMPNTTLPLKHASTTQSSLVLPVIVGIAVGFLILCAAIVIILARKYCCHPKHYRYCNGSRQQHAGAKSTLHNNGHEARSNGGAVAMMHDSAKPTIIANPLNASASHDKFSGFDDVARMMLVHGAHPSMQPNGAQLYTFNNPPQHATLSTKMPTPQQRFDNSNYACLPHDDDRSATTRTNSIVAMPVKISSQAASVVSCDGSSPSYQPQFALEPFQQQYTNFNTVNMNGAIFLMPHCTGEGAINQPAFLTATRPHMLGPHQVGDTRTFHPEFANLPPLEVHNVEQLTARNNGGAANQNSNDQNTTTMGRNTRKRKLNQQRPCSNNHNSTRQKHHLPASESGVRSSSSLSNQSAASPSVGNQLQDQVNSVKPNDATFNEAYDIPGSVTSSNTMSSVGVPIGLGCSSALDRFKLQSVFGSCRIRCSDDLEATLERCRTSLSEIPRTRFDNLKFVEKLGEGTFGEIYLCEMHFVETDLDSAMSNSANGSASTSNNASGGSGHSSLSHPESTRSKRLCLAKLLRSALTGHFTQKEVQQAVTMELDREVAALCLISDINLMRLSHVVMEDENNFNTRVGLVLEYPARTSLFEYMRSRAQVRPTSASTSFTMHIAMQIASGMKHFESLNMTHCDLAARNCLMTDQFVVKIGDFAIANRSYEKHYYALDLGDSPQTRLPLRWMSWEALLRGRFSTRSDVWSFAVTVWELLTDCAEMPFSDLDDDSVIENLNLMHTYHEANEPYFPTLSTRHSNTNSRFSTYSDDVRSADESGRYKYLQCPANCSRELYDLMRECWNREEARRPTFREIHLFLQRKCIGYDPKEEMSASISTVLI